MIKTVSFAPPRQAGSRSSAKPTGAKTVPVETLRPNGDRAASGRTLPKTRKATAHTSLSFEFGASDEPEVEVAPPEVAPPEIAAPKVAAPASISSVTPISAPETVRQAAPVSKTSKSAKKANPAGIAPTSEAPTPIAKTETSVGEAKAPDATKTNEVKAKRARVPKDLAEQYGEKTVVRTVAPPVEAEIVKKRLNKVERQARRELIKPSEDLMARLALANQIAARKPKAEPRGKGWRFQCGRCGTTSYFETPGGLCACGTIAVKE